MATTAAASSDVHSLAVDRLYWMECCTLRSLICWLCTLRVNGRCLHSTLCLTSSWLAHLRCSALHCATRWSLWGTAVRRLRWLPLILTGGHEWWLLDCRLLVFTVCVWHCPMTSATCGRCSWWDPVALRVTGKISLALRRPASLELHSHWVWALQHCDCPFSHVPEPMLKGLPLANDQSTLWCLPCRRALALRSLPLVAFRLNCSRMPRWTVGTLQGLHFCDCCKCIGPVQSLWLMSNWLNHCFWCASIPHWQGSLDALCTMLMLRRPPPLKLGTVDCWLSIVNGWITACPLIHWMRTLHCRGLLGHLALPVSALKKFGTPLRHSHWISIYGTDDDTTENTQAVVSTGTAKKYKITVDGDHWKHRCGDGSFWELRAALRDAPCFQWAEVTGVMVEGSLEVKLPTIWTDEKQSREEAERRERLEERRVEEKE